MSFYARFHRYYLNNSLLILVHKPEATRVAGMPTWNGLGYLARAGEKELGIWIPILKLKPDPEKGKRVEGLVRFRPAPDWDTSQLDRIEELPLPQSTSVQFDDTEELYHAVKARIEGEGIVVAKEVRSQELDRVSEDGQIRIHDELRSPAWVLGQFHERAYKLTLQRLRADQSPRQPPPPPSFPLHPNISQLVGAIEFDAVTSDVGSSRRPRGYSGDHADRSDESGGSVTLNSFNDLVVLHD